MIFATTGLGSCLLLAVPTVYLLALALGKDKQK